MERDGTFWDRVKRQVLDGYTTTVDKADELARIGHRKLDIASLRRHVGKELMALGGLTYQILEERGETDVGGDPEVRRAIERVRTLKADIEEKEQEVDDIRRSTTEPDDGVVTDVEIVDESGPRT